MCRGTVTSVLSDQAKLRCITQFNGEKKALGIFEKVSEE